MHMVGISNGTFAVDCPKFRFLKYKKADKESPIRLSLSRFVATPSRLTFVVALTALSSRRR
jgi:hypothetical protein